MGGALEQLGRGRSLEGFGGEGQAIFRPARGDGRIQVATQRWVPCQVGPTPHGPRSVLRTITLCDLSKAFDSVNHNILYEKLARVKVDPFWFQDYLDNINQKVKINNTTSEAAPRKYGVPQGSLLGPILFTIFVSGLAEEILGCETIQYADDTQFVHTGAVDALPDLLTAAQATLSLARAYFNKTGSC